MSPFFLRQSARLLWLLWLVQEGEGPWERRCRIVADREGWDLRCRYRAFWIGAGGGWTATFEAEDADDPHPAFPTLTVFWSELLESPEEAYESLWRAWASDPECGRGTSPEEFDLRTVVFGA